MGSASTRPLASTICHVPTPITLADVLTTAAAVANYLAAPNVAPAHLDGALEVLLGDISIDDIGRPLSPLVRRPDPGAALPPVRDLAQRWLARLGGDPSRELTDSELQALRMDVAALLDHGPAG